jgi:hypothetical protein
MDFNAQWRESNVTFIPTKESNVTLPPGRSRARGDF